MTSADDTAAAAERPPVVVKKYANRRLYNTESSSYITLDNLAEMVRLGRDFTVSDARTGDDITRSVLTQIIVEEESKVGRAMLPIPFLRQLIGFYGDSLQGVVPGYLEQSMAVFAQQQKQMRDAVKQTMGTFLPPGFEEMGRQNLAMLERAMTLFSPFYRASETAPLPQPEPDPELSALRAEVERLRHELSGQSAPVVEPHPPASDPLHDVALATTALTSTAPLPDLPVVKPAAKPRKAAGSPVAGTE